MIRIRVYRFLTIALLAISLIHSAKAQSGTLGPRGGTIANPGYSGAGSPATNLVPVPSTLPMRGAVPSSPAPNRSFPSTNAPLSAPSVSLGQPTFDPYQSQGNGGSFPGIIPNWFGGGAPAATPPAGSVGFPVTPQPYGPAAAPNYTGPLTGTPGNYPPSIYPNTSPPAVFPNGINTPSWGFPALGNAPSFRGWNPSGSVFQQGPGATRLIQGPRLRHAWVSGGNGSDAVETHDSDISVAFVFPSFLYSNQPLYILPSFSLHQWDGPNSATGADLPSRAYSAFLEAGWQSDPNLMFGTELGVRAGVFTDFDTFNRDSFRIMGKALAKLRITPTTTLKLGAMYVDRNKIKVIPAGGFLWQPTPNSRYDIFFPTPKLSHYLSTVGVNDVWWYLAAEYGGGSWSIQRASGLEDSIDINEIRVLVGLEWGRSDLIRSGRRFGFFEAGYVFEREIEYRHFPTDITPDDTFVLRAGIGY